MHTSVTGFATFSDLYPDDPFFARIFSDAEQSVPGDYTIQDAFLFRGIRLCVR